jgi:pyruvate ferredoxin oxidoreductase alpha subunit
MQNTGPLFLELLAALALHGVRVPVASYVYGLGGRDIVPGEIEGVYHDLFRIADSGQIERAVTYLGVRE